MTKMISQNIEMLEAMEMRFAIAPYFLNSREQELISFVACFPYPAWIKDYNTRMIYLNPAYEKTYNVTVEEYNNKLDFEVWHNESANAYCANDKAVMESRTFVELTETYEDLHGVKHQLDVVKWPLIREGSVIGVAGMVRPKWQIQQSK